MAGLLFLMGCGGVGPAPCDGNPSACDGGAPDAGAGADAGLDAGAPDGGDDAPDGGGDAGEPGDAGSSDGGFVLLDYRAVRGPALTPTVLAEVPGTPWGLSATRVVVQHGCDGGACDLSWRDDTGAEVATARGVRGLNGSVVSRDGRLAALFQPRSTGTCTDTDGFTSAFLGGAWRLLDLASGAALFTQDPAVSAEYLDTAFLGGAFVRFFSFDVGRCRGALPEVRRTVAPFAVPAALPALPVGTWVQDELDDGRLLVSLPGDAAGVVLPDDPSSLFRFTDATGESTSHGAWVHAFERYPVQSVLSIDVADGAARRTPVPFTERDWFEETTSHRFAAVCSFPDAARRRPCLVLDGAGRVPPRALVQGDGPTGRRQLALAGRAAFAVYLDGDTSAPVRLDLEQGTQEPLGLPAGRARVVGDGRGVVFSTADEVAFITRAAVHRVPGRLAAVLSSELAGGAADLPQAQVLFAVTLSASGGEAWLHAWHLGTGRVARLTDSLNFNPPLGSAFAAETCGVPGFLRAAGAPFEQVHQAASMLHFTEFVPAASPRLRVFVMPVDLSAPPRLFAELEPGFCGAPLLAADGSRAWLPVPTATGLVRLVVAPLAP